MYLSRIELNENRRETMRALETPSVMHGAVESSIEGVRDRNLWRVDRFAGRCYLLILSEKKPSLSKISSQFGNDGDGGETKDYDMLIERVTAGQRWQFRLRANPIHCAKPTAKGERGRVHAHVTQEQQRNWLIARSVSCGFSVAEGEFDVIDTRWYKFLKHHGAKDKVTIRTATFEGVLTITDAEAFKQTLQKGIGKGKAYGCGLLTVMSL